MNRLRRTEEPGKKSNRAINYLASETQNSTVQIRANMCNITCPRPRTCFHLNLLPTYRYRSRHPWRRQQKYPLTITSGTSSHPIIPPLPGPLTAKSDIRWKHTANPLLYFPLSHSVKTLGGHIVEQSHRSAPNPSEKVPNILVCKVRTRDRQRNRPKDPNPPDRVTTVIHHVSS